MIFLGVGSNLGDKQQNLLRAYDLLEFAGVSILRKSAFYHSEAWGIRTQDSFINAVIEVAFEGSPEELLSICLDIENEMGRKRLIKWGPRLIDIDIITFHEEKWNSENLVLPHPYYSQRSFVLVPLAELEPTWRVAETGEHIQRLIANIPSEDACIRIEGT